MIDPLLTVAEVAHATGEPEVTIRRWIYDGVFPVERVGPHRRVRVRWSVVCRFFPQDSLRIPTHLVPS